MGKFTGVLLATDYDDTLYGTDFHISPENRAAIVRFIEEGGLFTVSTGRSYVNFAIQMEREQLPVNVPVILANGAVIYDFATSATLYERFLPGGTGEHLRQVCRTFPAVAFEAYHGDEVYTYHANAMTEKHLTRCHLHGLSREIDDMPTPWVKAILQDLDSSLLQSIQAYMLEKWGNLYEITFSNPNLLELTGKGANKGSAVLWLADYLNIHRDHIYCIGNGLNDISMLEVSAVPFAPANCYEEVKQAGATILTSCDESCIARLIDHLEKRYDRRAQKG